MWTISVPSRSRSRRTQRVSTHPPCSLPQCRHCHPSSKPSQLPSISAKSAPQQVWAMSVIFCTKRLQDNLLLAGIVAAAPRPLLFSCPSHHNCDAQVTKIAKSQLIFDSPIAWFLLYCHPHYLAPWLHLPLHVVAHPHQWTFLPLSLVGITPKKILYHLVVFV